jgi:hypothetical protein
LLAAGESIPRGAIFDRNGIPLAANTREQFEGHRSSYRNLGVDFDRVIAAGSGRQYPFGALTFHLLGDLRSRINWGAPNTSFIERDLNVTLQGYDDHAAVVRVRDRPDGPPGPVLRRDLRELIPLVRYRTRPGHEQVQRILRRDRDVRLTIDMRLQKTAAEIVEQHIRAANCDRGAAVVIDPATGYLLASVTYPWEGAAEAANIQALGEGFFEASGFQASLLDRPR